MPLFLNPKERKMKMLIMLTLLGLSASAIAQTTAGGANNQSSSSASTNAQGNAQSVTFNSTTPANTTTSAMVNSNSTQYINNSGTTGNLVDYQGSYTVKNVPSVNGPNLTTSNDTCMGSSSGSANAAGWGVSIGSTWTDTNCKLLKNSRELWNMGMKAAAVALLCSDAANRQALEMTGTVCPQSMTAEQRKTAFGPNASATDAVAASAPAPTATAPTATATVSQAPAPAPATVARAPVEDAVSSAEPVPSAQVVVTPIAEPAPESVQTLMPMPSTLAQARPRAPAANADETTTVAQLVATGTQ
jgi:hypothetical protein